MIFTILKHYVPFNVLTLLCEGRSMITFSEPIHKPMHYKGNMQYTHYHIIDLYLNDVKVARCDVKSDKVLLSVGVAIVGKAIIIGAMAFDCRMTSTEAKKEFDDAISSIYPGRYDSGGFMYLDTKDFIEDNLKYKKWKDDQL